MTARLLTADEVAERLAVPERWVMEASRRGELPVVRLGRFRRFDERDIEAWLDAQRATTNKENQ